MANEIPLRGGNFQDCLGNPIANGTITFELMGDFATNFEVLPIQVCPGFKVTFTLNSSGSLTFPFGGALWGNDKIPGTSYYLVSVYTAEGELVWGPNAQTVLADILAEAYDISQWTVNDIN